jgi:hypothetical protein
MWLCCRWCCYRRRRCCTHTRPLRSVSAAAPVIAAAAPAGVARTPTLCVRAHPLLLLKPPSPLLLLLPPLGLRVRPPSVYVHARSCCCSRHRRSRCCRRCCPRWGCAYSRPPRARSLSLHSFVPARLRWFPFSCGLVPATRSRSFGLVSCLFGVCLYQIHS